jgi:serine/threonine protein kinase
LEILDFQKLLNYLKDKLSTNEHEQFSLFFKANPNLIDKLNSFLSLNDQFEKELPSTNHKSLKESDLWNSIEKIIGFQFKGSQDDIVFPFLFGDYTLLKCISKKYNATVYQAQDHTSTFMIAVKVLNSPLDSKSDLIIRFKREADFLRKLNHPNIVKFLDHGEWNGQSFFAMEWLEGVNLSTLVDKNGPLPFLLAFELIRLTLIGLEYAWEHKIIHRDIKPSNIFLTTDGEIKILDFGLSKMVETDEDYNSITGSGQLLGTFDYIAPEQVFASNAVDFRADIYSLGCTLFKLLTGHAPFSQPELKPTIPKLMAHVNLPFPEIKDILPECPNRLIRVLKKMVEKKPDDRFQSFTEIIKKLDLFCKNINLFEHIELKSGIIIYKKKPFKVKKHIFPYHLIKLTSINISKFLWALIFLLLSLVFVFSLINKSPITTSITSLDPSNQNSQFEQYKPNKHGEIFNISLAHELHGGIWKGIWSKDLSSLYLAMNSGSIIKWDLMKNQQIWGVGISRLGKNQPAHTLSLSDNEEFLISGGTPNWVECLFAKNGQQIWEDSSHTQKVISSSISKDGVLAITGSMDKTIQIWNMLKGTLYTTPFRENHRVFSVGFLKENSLFFSATTQLKIRNINEPAILDIASGHPSSQFIFSKHIIIDSKDYFFSATQDGCVFCHQFVQDSLNEIFCWHDGKQNLAFQSIDVFVDSTNNTIKMLLIPWPRFSKLKNNDLNSFYILTQQSDLFLPIEEYLGHEQRVTSGQFSLDGKFAITTSLDSTCKFWKVK